MGFPAGGQGGGQVPVAGPVYLVHPAAQPGERLLPGVGGQGPPGRGRAGLVAAGLRSGRVRGKAVGQAGEQGGQRGVMAGLAGVEPGELLTVSGELVHDRGERVGGHDRLPGKAVASPGISPAGT